ncbi:glycoside hydrolase superfamily [Sordaria brevicollis]|uniref:Glycoside hydrolase superfamily n=1 Tax=Sordaria brevicollis TaxID=83679 RepID=A0AAE0UG70_SORBR|nr:glycoside hydrolase superfamily [Sordaria brevicollis]
MPPLPHQHAPRLITYYQTHHTPSGEPISVLPFLQKPGIHLTHLILAAIHINDDPNNLTLNDHLPSHERFTSLWAELRILQASGIKVLGMLGGAAKGSFTRLDVPNPESDVEGMARFETYYQPLKRLIQERGLDGLDLDVEEEMSLSGVIHLIDRLRKDFGPEFLITLAPVAAAMLNPRHNLSGFDYEALEVMRGKEIAWYNTQFYCGWGDCSNPVMYEMMIMKGWQPEKIVVGMITNPENGGGWVGWPALAGCLPLLVARHPRFGGVMGWEYFNSLPGARERPWEWAQVMTALLRGRQASDEGAKLLVRLGAPLHLDVAQQQHHQQQQGQLQEGAKESPPQQVEQEEKKVGGLVDEEDEVNAPPVAVPNSFEYHTDAEDE